MDGARRVTLSAAAFVLICFFLPWVQVSCGGLRDSETGLDFARAGDGFLWLVPVFMLVVLALGLVRFIWDRLPALFAFAGTVGGCLSAYLMYRERSSIDRLSSIIPTQWTAWYWLGLFSSIGVAASAFVYYVKRTRKSA